MKKLFNLLLLILLITNSYCTSQTKKDTLYFASWNLENLFDNVDDPDKNDEEYTKTGRKEWTDERIDLKLKNLSDVIREMNSKNGPSILGVTEVEHQFLLDSMISRYFSDRNYKTAYAESPDNRGIDNGVIFDADIFSLSKIDTVRVDLASGYPTRYIFQADLLHLNGIILHIFVNHWPSRRGGEEKSEPNRIMAADVLRHRINELYKVDLNSMILIMGDFNDEPSNKSIKENLGANFFNCENELKGEQLYNLSSDLFEKGEGTYLYQGDWNMLDQIIVSSSLLKSDKSKYLCDSFELFKPSFLLTKNGKYKGAATPTFGGSKYLGGFSDHIPVGAKFIFQNKVEQR